MGWPPLRTLHLTLSSRSQRGHRALQAHSLRSREADGFVAPHHAVTGGPVLLQAKLESASSRVHPCVPMCMSEPSLVPSFLPMPCWCAALNWCWALGSTTCEKQWPAQQWDSGGLGALSFLCWAAHPVGTSWLDHAALGCCQLAPQLLGWPPGSLPPSLSAVSSLHEHAEGCPSLSTPGRWGTLLLLAACWCREQCLECGGVR